MLDIFYSYAMCGQTKTGIWLNFPPPILEHFCHFSYKMPRWVSFCPYGVSFCPEYHPQSLFFTQQSDTPFRDIDAHKTPPSPPQNTPFPGLNLKVGKMNYSLGNLDPNWAKCLKSGQNFSRSGKKKLNHDRSSRKLNSHFLNLGHIVALYDHTVLANDLSWIPSWSLNLDAWMYWGWWSKRYNAALVVCTIYWCWCLLNYEFQQYLQHRTEKWHMTFFGRSSLTMPRHCSSCG